jgi:hypothetical protein
VNGFDYVRTMKNRYRPRTPKAALIAAEAGILPIEAIVYKATSVKPLFEEPYDTDELERVLAQPNLSFTDAMFLSEIFSAMTRGSDKEVALIAAESLTALENRWAHRVDTLREAYRPEDPDEGPRFRLARALFEEALIAGRSAPIRNYYLREAYYLLADQVGHGRCGPSFNLRIRCLLRLGLLEQAEAEIETELGHATCGEGADEGEFLALAVEAAYLRKDVRRIKKLLEGRNLEDLGLTPELKSVLSVWKG